MRFLLGVLLGIALGVAVGLVLAPQPGSETRKALREQLQKASSGEEEVEPPQPPEPEPDV